MDWKWGAYDVWAFDKENRKKEDKTEVEKKQEECEGLGEKDAFKKNLEEKKRELEELKEAIESIEE